jgi:hypothetical protein
MTGTSNWTNGRSANRCSTNANGRWKPCQRQPRSTHQYKSCNDDFTTCYGDFRAFGRPRARSPPSPNHFGVPNRCQLAKQEFVSTIRSNDRRWALHNGDVQQVLPTLPSCTYDGALCDPPYGLNFMGHSWDGEVPSVEIWRQVLRVCKPGAYLLAFGGTKTFHKLVSNIEAAGWEIRDTLCWLHGEGMPKGQNIGNALKRAGQDAHEWSGFATGLKPAWEPICLAQKPIKGTFAKNALKRGCGGLNVDGCRIGSSGGTKRSHQAEYPRLADGTEDRSCWARSGHDVEPSRPDAGLPICCSTRRRRNCSTSKAVTLGLVVADAARLAAMSAMTGH